jgi:hypothetical protein
MNDALGRALKNAARRVDDAALKRWFAALLRGEGAERKKPARRADGPARADERTPGGRGGVPSP